MNPLNNSGGLPRELMNNIQDVKKLVAQGNLINNQLYQSIQRAYSGQNLQQVVTQICRQRGINLEQLLKELQS